MKKAIYAFSGDPITYGHIDVIKRAADVFDEVVVAIGKNPDKKYTFSLDERTDMAKKSIANVKNASVTSFSGMLTDFAYQQDIPAIVKAVRNSADVEYERLLHSIGESQKLGVDTFVLFAKNDLAHISSSVVKAVQKEQGDIQKYVPLYVKQKLEERISGQYVIGITGEIGAGKSYIAEKFVEYGKKAGIEVHNLDLDKIAHRILGDSQEPAYAMVRRKIWAEFGDQIMSRRTADIGDASVGSSRDGNVEGWSIDRKALGDIVFGDAAKLDKLNKLMETPILVETRKEMYGKKGVLLINSALIAEADLSYIPNNNVLLVEADEVSRGRRLEGRKDQMKLKERTGHQYNADEKRKMLEEKARDAGSGNIWRVENKDGVDERPIESAFEQIINELKVKRT